VHLAEVKIPRYGNSLETLEVNVRGTEHVLNAAVEQGAGVVLGSTDEVYGRNPDPSCSEESALVWGQSTVNRWSLAVSKTMAEHLCFAYRERHGLAVTILRYFGAYGPEQALDWRGGPQSAFITATLRGEALQVHGDGLQTRTFTAVGDLIAGTLLAMENPAAEGEIFNLASRESISIINLAYLVWRLNGRRAKPRIEFIPYTDFSRSYEDVPHRVADISKAHYLLGFEPQVRLVDGLQQTIQWQANALSEAMR
jgi:UDP-glucose 4-epimerase